MRKFAGVFVVVLAACSQPENNATQSKMKPVDTEVETLVADSNAIDISLNSGTQVLIEGRTTQLDSLLPYLRNAYQTKGDTATVVLHVLSDTPYGNFAEVHRALEVLLNAQRDSVALLRYEKHFDDLKEREKTEITRTYHLRLIERIRR